MEIADLQVFIDLIDTHSFSKCASLNFFTQPAISQKIKRLEAEAGQPLLHRGKNGVVATPAGKIFYTQSQKIIKEYREINSQIKSLSGKVFGTIKIGATYSIGLYELNPLMKNFLKKFPEVNLDLEFEHASKIYLALMAGNLDLGFVAFPEKRPCLKAIPFKTDKMILVVHPKHPLSQAKTIHFKDIGGYDFIAFKTGSPTRNVLDKLFRQHRIIIKPQMEFGNIETIKRAVEANLGISILPFETVKSEIEHGLLKGITFSDVEILRPLVILLKRDVKPSEAIQSFIAELKA